MRVSLPSSFGKAVLAGTAMGLAALAIGFATGIGLGGRLIAVTLASLITGTFYYSLPAILLVGPGMIHLASYALVGSTTRADVLADPLTYAPLLLALFGTPVLSRFLRAGRFFPTRSAGFEARKFLIVGMALLLAMLVIRLPGTPAPIYGLTKTMGFVTFSFIPVLLVWMIVRDQGDLRKVLIALVVVGDIWLLTLLLRAVGTGDLNLYESGAGEMLGGASQAGSGIGSRAVLVTLVCLGLMSGPGRVKLMFGGSALLALAVLVLSGARASVAALLAGVFILLLVQRKVARLASRAWLIIGIAVVLSFGVFVSLRLAPSSIQERYVSPLQSKSYQARVGVQRAALEAWFSAPLFGNGTGSSAVITTHRDQPAFGEVRGFHPHNVTIELLAEVGLIGCLVFLITILTLLGRGFFAARSAGSPIVAVLVALVCASFVQAQGGADLTVHNDLWLTSALLAIGVASIHETSRNEETDSGRDSQIARVEAVSR